MGYSLKTDKDGFVRIEGDDASITFRCNKDRARLLSIMVSEEKRKMGVGRSIICAAETELFRRGISVIEADFIKDIEGVRDFLVKCGYALDESVPVISVDMERILDAKAVKKAMRCSFNDGFFMPAQDMVEMQWDDLVSLFDKLSIPIAKSELDYFSEELSGVVYNEDLMPKAFIFCSAFDDLLYVDFLGGVSRKEPQYIMVALQGLIRCFDDESKREQYKRIAMLLSDSLVDQLLKRALDGGTNISEIAETLHAEKNLSALKPEQIEEIPEALLTDHMMNNLIKEYAGFPIQKNVCWKFAYSAGHRGGQ